MASVPILAVDDHPTNLKLIATLLASMGYQVQTARDGIEALEAVQRSRPPLILMDLQLPGIDGFELTRRLKADPETRDIVIIAVTAYAMKGDEQKALAAGCDGYLSKPIDRKLLMEMLARYLPG